MNEFGDPLLARGGCIQLAPHLYKAAANVTPEIAEVLPEIAEVPS